MTSHEADRQTRTQYDMNAQQRSFFQVGITIAVLMGVFPPWTDSFRCEQLRSQSAAGYAFILQPPKARMLHRIAIDLRRLVVQWAVLGLVVDYGWLYLRDSTQCDELCERERDTR